MEYWIVVVDDEAFCLTNARNMLGGENMKVSCLKSGNELLRFVEKNDPDLILLDIMMPQMDGFETYSALRRYEEETGRAHIPVIFLTGEHDSEIERRGLKAGASDFIRKPFNKEVLKSRIYNTIENSRTIETLTEEATYDKLTGFLNKASGTRRISELCEKESGALMVMDLDNFKLVNDLFGHDCGDQVLKSFAEIIRLNTRETDVISRIGGDEFMGFFVNISSEDAIASLTDRFNTQLTAKVATIVGDDSSLPLGISVGVVMIPEHGRDYNTLFSLADSSLYMVKQNGKHGYAIFGQTNVTDGICVDNLGDEIRRVTQIVEERNDAGGAILLGIESFSIVYRYAMRFIKERGAEYVRVLFVLKSDDGISDVELAEASIKFSSILQSELSKSDVVTQYGPNRFFAFAAGRSRSDVSMQVESIIKAWDETGFMNNIRIDHTVE